MSSRPSTFTMRFLAQPGTVNFGGKVHGGTVMSWIDQAAYACATAWAQRYCVTAYVGGIQFLHPIRIGDVVEVEARVASTGRSSMNLAIEVRSGDLKGDELTVTTDCIVVMVAVDADGRSQPVTPYLPADDEAKALADSVRTQLAHRR